MKKTSNTSNNIAKSAGTVGFAVMCSRILGLVREQVFAALFGAGTAYDAFVVAFRIPNLLRDLFGEGALSAAFVTVFSDYDTNTSAKRTLAACLQCACILHNRAKLHNPSRSLYGRPSRRPPCSPL